MQRPGWSAERHHGARALRGCMEKAGSDDPAFPLGLIRRAYLLGEVGCTGVGAAAENEMFDWQVDAP